MHIGATWGSDSLTHIIDMPTSGQQSLDTDDDFHHHAVTMEEQRERRRRYNSAASFHFSLSLDVSRAARRDYI